MIIIPKEKSLLQGLNSHYVDIRKLIEHYQGEAGTGAVHFKSNFIDGLLFFDKDDVLQGFYEQKGSETIVETTIDRIIDLTQENNFSVAVYQIEPENVYFWANLISAEEIDRDLSTDFTNLKALIKKMCAEKLTGFIQVNISEGEEGGLLFFSGGTIIGGSYSWENGTVNRTGEAREELIRKTMEQGGTFTVSKIAFSNGKGQASSKNGDSGSFPDPFRMLEDLLGQFERIVKSDKRIKQNFDTLLRGKFVEKAEEYAFLDPFAGEFEYVNRKIRFMGRADEETLIKGVTETVTALAEDLDLGSIFQEQMAPFSKKYARRLESVGVTF